MPTDVLKSQFEAKPTEYVRHAQPDGVRVIVADHSAPTLRIRSDRLDAADPLQRLPGTVLAYERPLDSVGDEDWEAAK